MDNYLINFLIFLILLLPNFILLLFIFFLSSNLSERDENGKFFPESGDENFETASLFCNSSNNFILKLTFLFFKSISDIATSILSPPTNLEGLASDEFIAICDFFN